MKKGFIRSVSLLIVIALCLGAIEFTAFSESASQANLKQLSEWVEMADALLEKGTTYVAGKAAFDEAYDDAVSILEAGVDDAGEIDNCIDGLKTAWAGLKFETVTEITPNDGLENDTGFDNFGSSYKIASGTRPKIYYNINATDADFWDDIKMFYLYGYGYKTETVTEDLISGTTLRIGGAPPTVNGIQLSTPTYSKTAYSSSEKGYVARNGILRYEFSKTKLADIISLGSVPQIMFCCQGDNSPEATICAGSLFIVRSFYEQVPVSYELFKWITRAENLLGKGKTYTSGLDDFNEAIDAAKNATDSDDIDEIIDNIKTAWEKLAYSDFIEIAPSSGRLNDTGCANFGSYYKTAEGTNPFVSFTVTSDAAAALSNSPEEIYIYAYGYDTAAGLTDTKLYDNLYEGNSNAGKTHIRFTNSEWGDGQYPSNNVFTRNMVRKYVFSALPTGSSVRFTLGEPASSSATIVVGSLFIVKGTCLENLPSDRILTWIDRAEALLASGVIIVSGLDDFNEALAALYASDDPTEEQTLIDNIRTAWNNLCYESEPVAIGKPVFRSHSLVLAEEIGVNFFVDMSYLTDAERVGTYVSFDISNSDKVKVDAYDSSDTNESGYYRFTCYVSSVQMAEDITPTFHYGDGKTVIGSEYSVKDYIDYVTNHEGSYTENTVTLVKALGDYGHYARIYLNALNSTTNTAMAMYRTEDYNADDYSAYLADLNTLNGTGVQSVKTITGSGLTRGNVTYNLNFDSTTTLSVNIVTASAVSATIKDVEADVTRPADVVRITGGYAIRIPDIMISELGKTYEISATVGSASFILENLSGLSYIRAILNMESNTNGRKDAMAAFYDYYLAAQDFVAPDAGMETLNGEGAL